MPDAAIVMEDLRFQSLAAARLAALPFPSTAFGEHAVARKPGVLAEHRADFGLGRRVIADFRIAGQSEPPLGRGVVGPLLRVDAKTARRPAPGTWSLTDANRPVSLSLRGKSAALSALDDSFGTRRWMEPCSS